MKDISWVIACMGKESFTIKMGYDREWKNNKMDGWYGLFTITQEKLLTKGFGKVTYSKEKGKIYTKLLNF